MSDLVEILRRRMTSVDRPQMTLLREAANAIVRLREDRDVWKRVAEDKQMMLVGIGRIIGEQGQDDTPSHDPLSTLEQDLRSHPKPP